MSSAVQPTKYCHACAAILDARAGTCPTCGARQEGGQLVVASEKRLLPAVLLCMLFGVFGVHRFYAGKVGTGILQLVTLGGLGIWWMVDLIMLIVGAFTDGKGQKITQWT